MTARYGEPSNVGQNLATGAAASAAVGVGGAFAVRNGNRRRKAGLAEVRRGRDVQGFALARGAQNRNYDVFQRAARTEDRRANGFQRAADTDRARAARLEGRLATRTVKKVPITTGAQGKFKRLEAGRYYKDLARTGGPLPGGKTVGSTRYGPAPMERYRFVRRGINDLRSRANSVQQMADASRQSAQESSRKAGQMRRGYTRALSDWQAGRGIEQAGATVARSGGRLMRRGGVVAAAGGLGAIAMGVGAERLKGRQRRVAPVAGRSNRHDAEVTDINRYRAMRPPTDERGGTLVDAAGYRKPIDAKTGAVWLKNHGGTR